MQQNQTHGGQRGKTKRKRSQLLQVMWKCTIFVKLHDESSTVEVAKDHGLQGRWSLNEKQTYNLSEKVTQNLVIIIILFDKPLVIGLVSNDQFFKGFKIEGRVRIVRTILVKQSNLFGFALPLPSVKFGQLVLLSWSSSVCNQSVSE